MKIDYNLVSDRVKFWKKIIEDTKNFTGTSPPSIFVGKAFYPRVYVGILAPTTHHLDADILDFPEKWYQQKATIDQILNYRGQLIYSRFKASSVKRPSGKLTEVTQELAMSRKPIDVEIELKRNPVFRFNLNFWTQPIGNPAPILQAKLTENPTVEKKVDYIISDYDVKAEEAVTELYKYKLPVSRIQKIFSAGLLGIKIQRKFTPTRWSITAVDDILGKNLLKKIKHNQELGEILLFHNEYLGNHFEVLLIPGIYQYEFIEAWDIDQPFPTIASDFEYYWGRKDYADNTHGAFYSGRLACCEYLEKINRQATILVVREVKPEEYWAPVGVWEIRETVRDAFNKQAEKFDSVDEAIKMICQRMVIGDKWMEKSKLLKLLKEQHKIVKYF